MKNKIKILPENVANKIAAGEVVQRPASVLKELLENSLDADASSIEVFIKNSGKSLIQVIDDGTGMTEEDAINSIKRHSTSKIDSIEDLDNIKTFGFRGEALSSIAAVANLEIKTSINGEIGSLIVIDGENDSQITKEKAPKGTAIAIKNLFYNTPARRKFLKSTTTELKHLIDTFNRAALSNPTVTMKFWNHDDLIFDYIKGDLEDRMKDLIADNIFEAIIKVGENTEYLNVSGYVSKPTFLKKSKGEQYLFINGRYVVSKSINHAVFSAYENLLERGEYPFFVLFIELDPSKVDVNVHPSKLEVKFENEKDIYKLIKSIVRKSIGQYDLTPSMALSSDDLRNTKLYYDDPKLISQNDFSDRPSKDEKNQSGKREKHIFDDSELDALFGKISPNSKKDSPSEINFHPFEDSGNSYTHESKYLKEENQRNTSNGFLISLHNKYILSPIKSGLMVIDQHVAHERILYEKALNAFEADIPFSQQLLFAQTIQVDPADYQLLKDIEPYLIKLGFELKFFSKNTIVIAGVPSDVKVGREIETLQSIIYDYRTNEEEKHLEEKDKLAKSFSCHAAIKAGEKLSEKEMRVLVDELFATSMPYVCPHGRPIIIKVPLDEFDKRFGRT